MQLDKLNSQGGLILILAFMWMFTLLMIMGFGVWLLYKGIDPTNAIVTTLLGVLVGTAFGSVNGALFTSMNGTTPPAATTSTTTSTTVIPPNPPSLQNNSSQGSETQGKPILQPVINANSAIKVPVKNQFP